MSERPQLVFPDTNVLIQGRPVHELPWEELRVDEIELIICGPVIRELDRLKNKGGRAGRVARAMSTTVRTLMKVPEKFDVIRESGPRVVRRLLLGLAIREPVRQGLDLTHDDQSIINQALARLDAGDDVLLLTDDNFAAMTAEEYGLPVKLLPTHWLKEPEADDSGREISRRDAEIARLKAAEPSPQLRFVDAGGDPIEQLKATVPRYRPVPEADVERLIQRVADVAPLAEVEPTEATASESRSSTGPVDVASLGIFGRSLPPIPVTKDDIEKYRLAHTTWLASVRSKIENLHKVWNRRRQWPSGQMLAANTGTRPAEDVLVELTASGRFELSGNRKAREEGPNGMALDMPPSPPRVRQRTLGFGTSSVSELLGRDPLRDYANVISPLAAHDFRRDDDQFYWRVGKSDPVGTMELECKVWRHGREEEDFPFHIWATDEQPVVGLIIGRVSASNLAQPVEARLPLRIEFEDKDLVSLAEKIVDDFEQRMKTK